MPTTSDGGMPTTSDGGMLTADVLVVGAGLAGAATAWRLAAAGVDVVLVERDVPASAAGSSHGSARIFRHAYPDAFHAELTVRALAGWRELEAASGRPLLTVTGGLDFGPLRQVDAIAATLDALGLEHELLTAAAAEARWPQHRFDSPVLHHAGAGVVDAASAVLAMVALAEAAGAVVRSGWIATSFVETGAGIRVGGLTDAGVETIEAGVVVIAAGGFLPEFAAELPGAWALPPLTVTQQQAFHFRFPAPVDDPADWPIFVSKGELSVYSLPGGRDAGFAGFKIAEHDGGRTTTASGRDGLVDPAARDRIIDYVRRQLPGVEPEPYAETTCLYTSTPSEDFMIDRIGRVVVASPCSGHGAKFAPLLGEIIADVATGRAGAPERFRLAAHGSAA